MEGMHMIIDSVFVIIYGDGEWVS